MSMAATCFWNMETLRTQLAAEHSSCGFWSRLWSCTALMVRHTFGDAPCSHHANRRLFLVDLRSYRMIRRL